MTGNQAVTYLDRLYGWRRRIFRYGIWNILYRFWIKLHVDGWENIPADGPVILVGNHISMLDPVIMISFHPDRDIVPMAKTEAWGQFFMRYFVRHWGAIPVNRGEADLSAFKNTLERINQGDIAMLYAEGTRSKTGMIEAQEGIAYLALKTNATIVPVAIWGTPEFPGVWFKEFRRVFTYIRFGRPFRFRWSERKLPRKHFRQMTDEAMYRIAELLPAQLRGVYSDLSQATTDFIEDTPDWRPVRSRLPARVIGVQGRIGAK
ncbi:MAG: 1-acyl-sn-glycerol-3-phosphate acyltransferase [Anaerolineae bacterium]|nr:1-acyl-sn-glycerol-3-phosphate acyltransferase [Anaerolineae bacterium]